MHIRQIALVARDLEPVVDDLCAVLGLEVCFHDPGVKEFGLRNALLAVGDTFLEVVCPERDDATAARYLARRGGDGGYMVILQTDDLARERARLGALGVRTAWEIALPDIATVHLHPKDVGGAIVSIDEPSPPDAWRWGGPHWREKVRMERVTRIAGVTLQSDAPDRLAARWHELFGGELRRLAPGRSELALERGQALGFVPPEDGRGEGLVAVRLAAVDAGAVRAAARERGRLDAEGRVSIGGVRLELAQRRGPPDA
jgi:hypothetical protein